MKRKEDFNDFNLLIQNTSNSNFSNSKSIGKMKQSLSTKTNITENSYSLINKTQSQIHPSRSNEKGKNSPRGNYLNLLNQREINSHDPEIEDVYSYNLHILKEVNSTNIMKLNAAIKLNDELSKKVIREDDALLTKKVHLILKDSIKASECLYTQAERFYEAIQFKKENEVIKEQETSFEQSMIVKNYEERINYLEEEIEKYKEKIMSLAMENVENKYKIEAYENKGKITKLSSTKSKSSNITTMINNMRNIPNINSMNNFSSVNNKTNSKDLKGKGGNNMNNINNSNLNSININHSNITTQNKNDSFNTYNTLNHSIYKPKINHHGAGQSGSLNKTANNFKQMNQTHSNNLEIEVDSLKRVKQAPLKHTKSVNNTTTAANNPISLTKSLFFEFQSK